MQRAADSTPYDCQICLSIPDGSVFQCRNSHLFCDECYASHRESGLESADQCPTCRVALPVGDDGSASAAGLLFRFPIVAAS